MHAATLRPVPRLAPLPVGLQSDQLIGMAYFDVDREPPEVVIGYVPRDLPGLDLSDPRTIRYRNTAGGFTPGQDEFTDYLSHISHLRVARSTDGEHFTFDDEARPQTFNMQFLLGERSSYSVTPPSQVVSWLEQGR